MVQFFLEWIFNQLAPIIGFLYIYVFIFILVILSGKTKSLSSSKARNRSFCELMTNCYSKQFSHGEALDNTYSPLGIKHYLSSEYLQLVRPIENYYWDIYVQNRFYNEKIWLGSEITHFYTYLIVFCLPENFIKIKTSYKFWLYDCKPKNRRRRRLFIIINLKTLSTQILQKFGAYLPNCSSPLTLGHICLFSSCLFKWFLSFNNLFRQFRKQIKLIKSTNRMLSSLRSIPKT